MSPTRVRFSTGATNLLSVRLYTAQSRSFSGCFYPLSFIPHPLRVTITNTSHDHVPAPTHAHGSFPITSTVFFPWQILRIRLLSQSPMWDGSRGHFEGGGYFAHKHESRARTRYLSDTNTSFLRHPDHRAPRTVLVISPANRIVSAELRI